MKPCFLHGLNIWSNLRSYNIHAQLLFLTGAMLSKWLHLSFLLSGCKDLSFANSLFFFFDTIYWHNTGVLEEVADFITASHTQTNPFDLAHKLTFSQLAATV